MSTDQSEKGGTILVIDDEPAVADVIKSVLTAEGYEVHVASDGLSGLKAAAKIQPDLIFMDITMPEMDGYQTAEKLKQEPALKDIPVVFLTGKSASEDAGQAFAAGGLTYIRKPFTNSQIRDFVTLAMLSLKE